MVVLASHWGTFFELITPPLPPPDIPASQHLTWAITGPGVPRIRNLRCVQSVEVREKAGDNPSHTPHLLVEWL